jgi:CheY-like chemotaxis protein
MQEDRESVLIVEDEALSALYVESILEGEYRIAGTAQSGEEAISLAEREDPSIIIMDVHLFGQIDGIEAARLITSARRKEARRQARFIFCSAYAKDEIGDPVGAGLGEAYLQKPFEPENLLSLLHAAR